MKAAEFSMNGAKNEWWKTWNIKRNEINWKTNVFLFDEIIFVSLEFNMKMEKKGND